MASTVITGHQVGTVSLGDEEFLVVGPLGILVGSPSIVAVNANGSGIVVTNAGIIQGDEFNALTVLGPSATAQVLNTGSIIGMAGSTTALTYAAVGGWPDARLDLVNEGTILGHGAALGARWEGGGSLHNTGTISGATGVWIGEDPLSLFLNEGSITGRAVGVHSTGGAVGGLVNTGTIAAPLAIEIGIAAAEIHNLGLTSGTVQLGRLADLYDGVHGTTLGRVLGLGGDDTLLGGAAADDMAGGQGADLLLGGGGDDRLAGEAGEDRLRGGEGDDTLRGGADADELDGGAGGEDALDYTGSAAVTVNLGTGEVIGGDAQGDIIAGFEAVTGGDGADLLTGDGGANTLRGGAGNDLLAGGAGEDRLLGDAGRDFLTGGLGADILRGGVGADRFRYLAAEESGPAVAARDRIRGFSQAEGDLIDLFQIDADTTAPGNQEFLFIGGAAFTASGQVRVVQAAGDTFVFANLDANLGVDLSIRLDGLIALSAGDFEL